MSIDEKALDRALKVDFFKENMTRDQVVMIVEAYEAAKASNQSLDRVAAWTKKGDSPSWDLPCPSSTLASLGDIKEQPDEMPAEAIFKIIMKHYHQPHGSTSAAMEQAAIEISRLPKPVSVCLNTLLRALDETFDGSHYAWQSAQRVKLRGVLDTMKVTYVD